MEEPNILHKMLRKGDKNMIKYDTFDFSKLDTSQHSYLKTLSIFSKYKSTLLKYFGMNKTSMEGKIAFLESHSMKLGEEMFCELEQARLMVTHGYYIFPYLTGGIAFGALMVFAWFTPMTSKLYREAMYSLAMGGVVSAGYLYYQKALYYECVNKNYAKIRSVFDKNPLLELVKEEDTVIKTFGYHRFNFADDINNEWQEENQAEKGIFDGHADEDGQVNRRDLINRIYGDT